MEIQTYSRTPFSIEAVRVTAENFDEVLAWCEGVQHNEPKGKYIQVPVRDPKNDRQKKAFIGDWVLLYPNRGFKSYTDSAFHKSFVGGQDVDAGEVALDSQPVAVTATPDTSNVFADALPTDARELMAVQPSDQIAGKL
jgi:ABC-type transporter lipoprotein component MlaA